MSAEENKAIVRRFIEDVLSGNQVGLVDTLFAPEYVNHLLPPGTPPGPEGEKGFIAMFRNAFPDFRMTVDDILGEDDRVAGCWTFAGTHTGAFQGMPPTGRRVTMTGMNIFRLAHGQIVDNRSNFDQFGMLQQMGAIPAAEPVAR
jgi:steroid delta-isomerase-like uncharacterized protein